MDGFAIPYPGPHFGDAFGASLPEDIGNEIAKQLPLESMLVLGRVSKAFAGALSLPAVVANVFLALNDADSAEQLISVFKTIPAMPPHVRVAIIRAFVERIVDRTSVPRMTELSNLVFTALSEIEQHFRGEPASVYRDAGKRDVLIATVRITMLCARYATHTPLMRGKNEMRKLPKWCWPEVIMVLEIEARRNDKRYGLPHDQTHDALPGSYPDYGDVAVLIDHLDEINGNLSLEFAGKLAFVWMKTREVRDVRALLLARLPLSETKMQSVERSLIDVICTSCICESTPLSDILFRWDSNATALYRKMLPKLINDAFFFRPHSGRRLNFHSASDIRCCSDSTRFEWVFGEVIERLQCLRDIENIALPFWSLYWVIPQTDDDVRAAIDKILTLPWELQPTLLMQLAKHAKCRFKFQSDDFALFEWIPMMFERCYENALYGLAVRSLALPSRLSRYSMSAEERYICRAMAIARERIAVSYWGEVVDWVVESCSVFAYSGRVIDDERLSFLHAFFSAKNAAWKTPSKPRAFIGLVISMWERLPDRSDGEMNRVDAFCAQFSLDKTNEEAFKKALFLSLRAKVDAGQMLENDFLFWFEGRRGVT